MATYEESSLCVFKQWISDKEAELSPVGLDNRSHNDSAQNANYSAHYTGMFIDRSVVFKRFMNVMILTIVQCP